MIEVLISNSIDFLNDLAAWLITPIPLTFAVLFVLVYVCQVVRGLFNG